MDKTCYNDGSSIDQNFIPTMLDHQKKVLEEVGNNKERFKRELIKSLQWISSREHTQLKIWVIKNFCYKYPDIISRIFKIDTACT
ncbi:hypothetical protein SAMN06265379_11425 [Saccharicrinis carchari]|uniref:Uncharacterized protein n=1 Tax=Saccharicrinis carchari TaxID=1168039 RepID=A0A521F3S5_SACCC|nr:hypothetical protein [Saccharicrinis carchari]SMO90868.1 hypothetical protein SAMN06265379_11425 [Saccharicrinis carchari]